MYSLIGCKESELGIALKYNEPLKKWFELSVTKNCRFEALFP